MQILFDPGLDLKKNAQQHSSSLLEVPRRRPPTSSLAIKSSQSKQILGKKYESSSPVRSEDKSHLPAAQG